MSTEFILWDEHELTLRLSKPEHRGRWWFWFNGLTMTEEWFRRHVAASAALALASDRYASDFNVELPIIEHFEALGRTPAFAALLDLVGSKLNEALANLRKNLSDSSIKDVQELKVHLEVALAKFNELPLDPANSPDFTPILSRLEAALKSMYDIRCVLWAKERQREEQIANMRGREPGDCESSNHSFSHYVLDGISERLSKVVDFCSSLKARLARLPVMLLTGEAGNGKTQLVCTVAERRATAGLPTILMLGEQFDGGDPFGCILRIHGLSCNRDEFLGALNAAGEAVGCRALVLIDAVNEGVGVSFWNKHLASILSHLRYFPYIGVAITIRNAYEAHLEGLKPPHCVRVEHHGFAGRTNEASREFFKHYGLAEPNVPLLNPEFDNPLLLKLLCRAVHDSGGQINDETFGVTSVFDLVLDRINRRLADETILDYDVSQDLVGKAVLALAGIMAKSGEEFVPLEEARTALLQLYPSEGHSRSLLKHLTAEHVVVRMPMPGFDNPVNEVLRFTYQRLSDHLIVGSMLARTAADQLPKLLSPDGTLGRRMINGGIHWIAGWIEALAIQLPERFQVEIDEALGCSIADDVIQDAFVKSLVWRKTDAFTNATQKRVEELLILWNEEAFEILDELIAVTARPDHPLNADWLDGILHPQTMAERDAVWSIYLYGKVEEESNIRRLIEWAWADREHNLFDDGVVRLGALTLVWCLTTSDRFVRDQATKALVGLLEQRVQILDWLLAHFADVDEPYVQERLYGVAYGCAMRTLQTAELRKLAQGVYDKIFHDGSPPPSVLLRDYARGVVDCAVRRGIDLQYDNSNILPPFCSTWPKSPPSLDKLAKLYHSGLYNDQHRGLRRIFHSVTNDDFEHYVIRDVTDWSHRRKSPNSSQSPRQMFQKLLASLSDDDAGLMTNYAKACRAIEGIREDKTELEWHKNQRELVDAIDRVLPVLLGKQRARKFQSYIAPFLKNPHDPRYRETFSVKLFQRLILSRVLEFGWTTKRFGTFDERVRSSGRESHKPERIGKKYQWIAYDEFHARISDNFGMAETDTQVMSDREWEQGLWPLKFRDIDPSMLLKSTPRDGWGVNHVNWWTPLQYVSWDWCKTPFEWLKASFDLPPPETFLNLVGPDGQRWIMLEGYVHWRQDGTLGVFKGKEGDKQELHYIFKSYLVRREHLKAMMAWGRRQNWINDRMPQPTHRFRQYLNEHYWSAHFDGSLEDEWVSELWRPNDLPHPFVETTGEYMCEHNAIDCSMDSSIVISLPSRWLVEKMKLRMTGRRGDFLDKTGRLTAYDPSTRDQGHSALVTLENSLRELLDQEGLALIWTLLGEKNIYPPEHTQSWLGRMTILGIYSWDGRAIGGDFRTEFAKGHN